MKHFPLYIALTKGNFLEYQIIDKKPIPGLIYYSECLFKMTYGRITFPKKVAIANKYVVFN